MIGRFADLFRLAWGLLYWNIRKTWFQLRPGRVPCPCQSASDSGRGGETRCEACLSWHEPARFRRVCPLLVETPDGLRCSVDTAHVRPFWRRALGIYTGSALSVYLAIAVALFIFLRTVGYPISIVHLVWPGSWHRVGEVRGWFFADRAQRAFAAGRVSEGMLYLANAYEFDRKNYVVGLMLAQKLEFTHAQRADEIYRQLVALHPDKRDFTHQAWFRAVLARGDFAAIEEVARLRLVEDPTNASVWMRALIFATRQTANTALLRELLESPEPGFQPWRPVLETELSLRTGHLDEARARLNRPWTHVPAYGLFYQIKERIALGDGIAAVDQIEANRGQLDDTARASLLLDAYATMQASRPLDQLVTVMISPPVKLAGINVICAHLIRRPDHALLDRTFAEFLRARIALTDDSLETYLALYCAAGVVGDWSKMHALAGRMRAPARGNALTLSAVEAFFRGQTNQTRIAGLLPNLPMPLEAHYALLERYPGSRSARTTASVP